MPIHPAAAKLPALKPGEFRFVTKAIDIGPAPEGGGGRRFHTIASSTIKDLGNDRMKSTALADMAESFTRGLTIFMNHSYKVPEDVFGRSDGAEIKDSGLVDPKSGQPIWDLHIYGVVNEPNERARSLADSMEGGYVTFGTSVGAIVKAHTRNKDGGMDIDHVDCKEGSIVGIPMNQRSWTQKAATAAQRLEDSGSGLAPDDDDDEPAEAVTEAQATTEAEKSAEAVIETPDPAIDTTKAGCPSCGKGRDASGCDNDYHKGDSDGDGDSPATGDDPDHDSKSAEDVLAVEAIIKQATEGGQESAPVETPETAPEAEVATDPVEQKVAALDPDVVELAKKAVRLAEIINARDEVITTLRDEIATLKAENARLTSENEEAGQVIERVMRLPLRRKAQDAITVLDARLPDFLPTEVKALLSRSTGDNA